MLTMVEVINDRDQNIEFPLVDQSAGYLVKEVDGLDPVKATFSSSTLAQVDGTQFHHARRDARTINLSLEFIPDFVTTSVESLRKKLYAIMMPKMPVTIKFYFDNEYLYQITGRVEDLDAPMFTDKPGAEISITCFDPDFKGAEELVFSTVTTTSSDFFDLDYIGTEPTGFLYRLHADTEVNSSTFWNQTEDSSFAFSSSLNPLLDGDRWEVSTVSGAKSSSRIRAGVKTNILGITTGGAPWPRLLPGINTIRALCVAGAIPIDIVYTPRYGAL